MANSNWKPNKTVRFNPYEQQDIRRVIWEQSNLFISEMALGISASDNNPDAMHLVLGAGTRLEMLDAELSIYWQRQKNYIASRDKIKKKLASINIHDSSLRNRRYVKDLYALWWNRMSKLFAYFNFFPAIPTQRSIVVSEADEDDEPILL